VPTRPTRTARLKIWLVVATTCLILVGCGGARARYTSHLERGQAYLAAGNLDKAGIEFRNAAQIQPKEADPVYFNGRVAEARGNIREAVSLYQAAVDANPNAPAPRAHLGKLLVFAGAPQRAIDTVAPALTAHPDDPDLLAVRAAARHALRKDEDAKVDAEHAVRVAPTNENAVAVLAALYAQVKDYPKAISLVSGAVSQAPASVDLREVLVNLYLATAQPDKAEEEMRKIIDLKPSDLSVRSQLAAHLARAHRLDAAQQVLEEAIESLSKGKNQVRADEAKLLLVGFIANERSRAQGEMTLRRFIATDPGNLDLRLGLAALLQRTGTAKEAIATYQEVIKQDGTGAKGLVARDRIAAIELDQGHADAARQLLSEVLQKNPRDDDALLLRATMESHDNKPADAIADLRAVLRDQPNSIQLQRMLASAYVAKGDLALAEETLRASMQSATNDVSVRIELAQLLARTDRAAQGVTLLEETVTRLPDNIPAREALIRAYVANHDLASAHGAAEALKTRQPQSAAGYYLAGLIAVDEKHLQESERNFERALELQPRDVNVLGALARVEISRGASDQAISRVQAAVETDPKSVPLLTLLGGLLLEKKDFKGAGEAFARASALDPSQWQSHRNLALVKVALDDPESAVVEYQAALRIAPAEPQLVQEATSLYEKQKRIDAAIAAYEALYRLNPPMQQLAANNLAMLLVTYKTDQASLDRARDLTSGFATSTNSSLVDTVGWVRFKRGEYQEALPLLERAMAGAPDAKIIRYHLAMDELRLGLRDRARSDLETALAGSESFSGAEEARDALASLKSRSG
jgi:tetratricopeptide (TPR) repeat protein